MYNVTVRPSFMVAVPHYWLAGPKTKRENQYGHKYRRFFLLLLFLPGIELCVAFFFHRPNIATLLSITFLTVAYRYRERVWWRGRPIHHGTSFPCSSSSNRRANGMLFFPRWSSPRLWNNERDMFCSHAFHPWLLFIHTDQVSSLTWYHWRHPDAHSSADARGVNLFMRALLRVSYSNFARLDEMVSMIIPWSLL